MILSWIWNFNSICHWGGDNGNGWGWQGEERWKQRHRQKYHECFIILLEWQRGLLAERAWMMSRKTWGIIRVDSVKLWVVLKTILGRRRRLRKFWVFSLNSLTIRKWIKGLSLAQMPSNNNSMYVKSICYFKLFSEYYNALGYKALYIVGMSCISLAPDPYHGSINIFVKSADLIFKF